MDTRLVLRENLCNFFLLLQKWVQKFVIFQFNQIFPVTFSKYLKIAPGNNFKSGFIRNLSFVGSKVGINIRVNLK